MPSYKLTYFNGMARAEVARFLFALGDIEYEDKRVEREEWLKIKPDTPFGQLPTLEIKGDDGKTTVLCQQRAIEGLLARKVGACGSTDLDFAWCQMLAECVEDMFKALQKTFSLPEEEKPAAKEEYAKNGIKPFLEKFEKILSKDGFFLGTSISWPDISLAHGLHNMPLMGVDKNILDDTVKQFPNIMACRRQMESNKKCEAWIKKRPESKF